MTQVKIKQIEGFETLDTSSFTQADDGKLFYYDNETGKFITDDTVTHGTVILNCKKSTAGTIQKGTPVYLVGFDNDIHTVEAADASDSNKMPVIGIAAEDLDNTNSRHVTTFGKVVGVDTSSYIVGTNLYMGVTAGEFSSTRPTGANTQIQRIAKVLKSNAISGQILVYNTARTAGLPNLGTDKLWIGDANGIPQEVDKSTIGGGGGGHEIYNGTDVTPLTQRTDLRFKGYIEAVDDAINSETVVDLSSSAITPTEISRFDENGSGNIDLKIQENKLLTGNVNGFATELTFAQEGILGLDVNNEVKEFEVVEIYNILKEDAVTGNKQLALLDINGTSANIKPKFEISAIAVQNTTANAVTINIGSTALGTNVANTVLIGANATLKLPLGTTFFSTTLGQNLFISSSSWNSASINIHVTISKIWQ